MIVRCYVIVHPKADRDYVSTTPPSSERILRIRAEGGEVYEASILIPGKARPLPIPLMTQACQVELHSEVP